MLATLAVMGTLGLAGCGQPAQSAATQSTAVSQKAQHLDRYLTQLQGKVPEDQGTQSTANATTSQFYQRNGQWYWRLTTAASGTKVQGKIVSVTKQNALTSWLTVAINGKHHRLRVRWTDQAHYAYQLKSTYKAVLGYYVLCDGQSQESWVSGAPQTLQGTWKSPLYVNGRFTTKQYPYMQTTYTIGNDSTDETNTLYQDDKRTSRTGKSSDSNGQLQYKQLGTNTYMLKSYTTANNALVLNEVHLANQKLTIYDHSHVSPVSAMQQTSEQATTASQEESATTTQRSSSVDTRHLTTAQVTQWCWQHYQATMAKEAPKNHSELRYSDYLFEQGKDDQGNLMILVKENHSTKHMKAMNVDPHVNPTVYMYRINGQGELEAHDETASGWHVVATTYGE